MQNWESLIAKRSRPCATICAIEDPALRARKIHDKRHEEKRKTNPARIAYKKKYREEHRDEANAKKRAWRATPEGKKATHDYNERYRLEHYEQECARKRKWYHEVKNPNPKPTGRPRKNPEEK